MWDAIASFFSNNAAPIIGGVAALGGAAISTLGNNAAADKASNATRDAAQIGADALREGQRLADERLEKQRRDAEPAVQYLKRVMAQDPGQLTPEQLTARDNMRRDVNARLSASGLRGAGRAGVAAANRADLEFSDNAFTTNQRRADTAATGLAGDYNAATRSLADLDRATASSIGNISSRAVERGGTIDANAGLANANQWGSAMGMIGSIIADEKKGRQSNYPPPGQSNQTGQVPAPV